MGARTLIIQKLTLSWATTTDTTHSCDLLWIETNRNNYCTILYRYFYGTLPSSAHSFIQRFSSLPPFLSSFLLSLLVLLFVPLFLSGRSNELYDVVVHVCVNVYNVMRCASVMYAAIRGCQWPKTMHNQ